MGFEYKLTSLDLMETNVQSIGIWFEVFQSCWKSKGLSIYPKDVHNKPPFNFTIISDKATRQGGADSAIEDVWLLLCLKVLLIPIKYTNLLYL